MSGLPVRFGRTRKVRRTRDGVLAIAKGTDRFLCPNDLPQNRRLVPLRPGE